MLEFPALLVFVLAVLANWQTVETWHHGSIFESWRAKLESYRDWRSELSGCPFCLGHWTGAGWAALGFTALTWQQGPAGYDWLLLPLFALAVIRVSQWLNDLNHSITRTPHRKE